MSLLTYFTKRRRTVRRLRDLTPERLHRESVRLDQLMHLTLRAAADRRAARAACFDLGRRASGPGEAERLAGAVHRHDVAVRHLLGRARLLHQRLRLVEGLAAARGHRGLLNRLSADPALAGLSADAIATMAEDLAVEGRAAADHDRHRARLLDGAASDAGDDGDVRAILTAMRHGR